MNQASIHLPAEKYPPAAPPAPKEALLSRAWCGRRCASAPGRRAKFRPLAQTNNETVSDGSAGVYAEPGYSISGWPENAEADITIRRIFRLPVP